MPRTLLCSLILFFLFQVPAFTQGTKPRVNQFPKTASSLSHNRPSHNTMACPKQISLGMDFAEFSSKVRAQLGPVDIKQGGDDEVLMVQVPNLHIFLSGYGEIMNPDFMFAKTKNGALLSAIQEDVTDIAKPVLESKIANLMAIMGAPRVSKAMDESGLVSSTWQSDTDRHVILSIYKYSDGHTLFVIGDTDLSPELSKL